MEVYVAAKRCFYWSTSVSSRIETVSVIQTVTSRFDDKIRMISFSVR